MGTLHDMISFLDDTAGILSKFIGKLENLQQVFNTNFNHVVKIRESEIEFLQEQFFDDPSRFPEEVGTFYREKFNDETQNFQDHYGELTEQRNRAVKRLEEINKTSGAFTATLKKSNVKLDRKEEKLKKQISSLEDSIASYNKRIDELGTGFGFLLNIFKMKEIEKEKKTLLTERDELTDQIESIRGSWQKAEEEFGTQDEKLREEWTTLQTEISILAEKLSTLERNRDILIQKAAFAGALHELKGYERFLTENIHTPKPDTCRKCGSENKKNLFFCYYCGEPFQENRPDIEGSLVETGELNSVFSALSEGIRSSVSLIALMRGIRDGVNTFIGSVKKVKDSEDKYPQLPTLRITIPGFSAEFAEKIKEAEKSVDVDFYNLHPLDFAEKMKSRTVAIEAGENIEKFFTLMGDELNKRTKEQWK